MLHHLKWLTKPTTGGPNENINILKIAPKILRPSYKNLAYHLEGLKKMMNDYQKDLVVPFFDSNI